MTGSGTASSSQAARRRILFCAAETSIIRMTESVSMPNGLRVATVAREATDLADDLTVAFDHRAATQPTTLIILRLVDRSKAGRRACLSDHRLRPSLRSIEDHLVIRQFARMVDELGRKEALQVEPAHEDGVARPQVQFG